MNKRRADKLRAIIAGSLMAAILPLPTAGEENAAAARIEAMADRLAKAERRIFATDVCAERNGVALRVAFVAPAPALSGSALVVITLPLLLVGGAALARRGEGRGQGFDRPMGRPLSWGQPRKPGQRIRRIST
jgi:hypothetical protein